MGGSERSDTKTRPGRGHWDAPDPGAVWLVSCWQVITAC